MARPPKPPAERLVTLSVRVPQTSLDLLDRIVDGERRFLQQRDLPSRGVNRSAAFRTIWELGEIEYVLQRVTLWVTRKTNRYTVDQAAQILGWKPDVLADLLRERGIEPETGDDATPTTGPKLDPRFLD